MTRESSWRQTTAVIAEAAATKKASARRTPPTLAITAGRPATGSGGFGGVRRELRRALGDQRFRFADEGAVFHRSGEDDLAAAAERVGHHALVADRHRAAAVAVLDFELQGFALVMDRFRDDFGVHLELLAGRRGEDLRRFFR